MLDQEAIRNYVRLMWQLHNVERILLDRVYGYVSGTLGVPAVPEGSPDEIKDLARLSVKNVLSLVRDSFTQNLSVVGYKTALAKENAPAWEIWQRNRMDARQAEVYRPGVTYGASYVTVVKDDDTGKSVWRARSPRQLMAVYEEPTLDMWPQFAFEIWVDQGEATAHWRGMFYDETYVYPLDLGERPTLPIDQYSAAIDRALKIMEVGEPLRHGAKDKCPVVRFVNAHDADDMIVGEVAPLIRDQQAINSVNFDRLLVSRFGAFPQRVISGWSGGEDQVLAASARRVWTFEDTDVKAMAFPPAALQQYNDVLNEMTEAVALRAQISPSQITGKLVNVSAEALAAAEANEQRKLAAMRDSYGESWEQTFRLAAEIEGDTASADDDASEVQWRDTEARAFGAIVDGVTKLASAGIPLEELLDMVPGLTQQKIQAVKDALRLKQSNALVAALRPPPPPAAGQPEQPTAPNGAPTAAAPPTRPGPVAPAAAPPPSPGTMPRMRTA